MDMQDKEGEGDGLLGLGLGGQSSFALGMVHCAGDWLQWGLEGALRGVECTYDGEPTLPCLRVRLCTHVLYVLDAAAHVMRFVRLE
jgi:hypothetical protein